MQNTVKVKTSTSKPLKLEMNSFKLFYSIFLFYPITLAGRQGTTDEFATIPFHLVLFSAAQIHMIIMDKSTCRNGLIVLVLTIGIEFIHVPMYINQFACICGGCFGQ